MTAGLAGPGRALRSGYPFRTLVVLGAALAAALVLAVLPLDRALAWWSALGIILPGAALVLARTWRLRERSDEERSVMEALGRSTAELPASLRTRMPVFLVSGDGLAQLFDREGQNGLRAFVGEGAIWLRISSAQDLPRVAAAVRRWRDGRAPDGVVLTLAPALHADDDALAQQLRLTRQAISDASRLLGSRLPGYVAIYQRLGRRNTETAAARWYGVSSATPLAGAARFEPVVRAAERAGWEPSPDGAGAERAAALAALVDWTQRAVAGPLSDRHHPAAPVALYGVGWIDCGPQDSGRNAWKAALEARTQLACPAWDATPAPWPLPQPIVASAHRAGSGPHRDFARWPICSASPAACLRWRSGRPGATTMRCWGASVPISGASR
jgi:hypothetical protein